MQYFLLLTDGGLIEPTDLAMDLHKYNKQIDGQTMLR